MWWRHSGRMEPMSLSTQAFCQGDRGAIGWSRMPIARIRCKKTGPYEVSRSRIRYRGAWSHGNASVAWREIPSAVGFAVTPNDTQRRRPWRTMTRQYRIWNAIVGRTKRSIAAMPSTCLLRNVRQPWDGGREWRHIIPSDRRLGYREAELEQLTMNTRRAPKRVRTAHLANERAQLSRDLRSANTVAGSPAPIRPKPSTVPANDGLRPEHRNPHKDGRNPAIEQTK